MRKMKAAPITILSIVAISVIIIFLIIGASGFRGLIPGSNLYRNKRDFGYHVFYRLLEELDYEIEFESQYDIPSGRGNSVVYLDMNEVNVDSNDLLMDWVKLIQMRFLIQKLNYLLIHWLKLMH